jgi:hypothetical protein
VKAIACAIMVVAVCIPPRRPIREYSGAARALCALWFLVFTILTVYFLVMER